MFLMNGTTVQAGSGYTNAVPDQKWQVVGTGDFDGDGKADILWRNSTTGQDYIFLMNGTTVQASSGYTNAVRPPGRSAGTGDFDGDGKADILWRNTKRGQDYIFLMDGTQRTRALATPTRCRTRPGGSRASGTSTATARPTSCGATTDGSGLRIPDERHHGAGGLWLHQRGAGAGLADRWDGDFDGDGKADILWRNSSTGEDYIFLMNGTTVAAGSGYTNTVPVPDWQIVGTGDYDGDGHADILWRNSSTGEDYLFLMYATIVLPGSGYTNAVPLTWQVQSTK